MTLQERVKARANAKQGQLEGKNCTAAAAKKLKKKEADKRNALIKLANALWSHTRHASRRQFQITQTSSTTSFRQKSKGLKLYEQQLQSSSTTAIRQKSKGIKFYEQQLAKEKSQTDKKVGNTSSSTQQTTTVMKLREIVALFSKSTTTTTSSSLNTLQLHHQEKMPRSEVAVLLMELSKLVPNWIDIAQNQVTPRTGRLVSTATIAIKPIEYHKVQTILGISTSLKNNKTEGTQHQQQQQQQQHHDEQETKGQSLSSSFGQEALVTTPTTSAATTPVPSRARIVSMTPVQKQETSARAKETNSTSIRKTRSAVAKEADEMKIKTPSSSSKTIKHSIFHRDVPREKKRQGLRKSKDIVPYENRDNELAPAPKKPRTHKSPSLDPSNNNNLKKNNTTTSTSTRKVPPPLSPQGSSSSSSKTVSSLKKSKVPSKSTDSSSSFTTAGRKRPASPPTATGSAGLSSITTTCITNHHKSHSSNKKKRGLRINENFILTDGDYDGGEIIQPSYTSPRGLKKLFEDLKEGRRI
eukprot:CAMPEP_0195285480 /NCGR_PEP_ID=MMETSP0707-20130614/3296_1 /TAXON_ID=33640 /ORGANISM="Asterionellopsis glacialis, Strain CCMP134" /LENGTH=525 /DNA_ID=CAMNT_0040344975 /DNA_START=39 /DNA_END=1616 /DNA_ORIENTATION=-